jgi:hypothetical protein
MSKSTYDGKAKARTIRYLAEKREKLGLNLPKGTKEKYKKYAKNKGKSITELIIELLEKEMHENP